jgi:hypothetical protein
MIDAKEEPQVLKPNFKAANLNTHNANSDDEETEPHLRKSD